ncbi:helix-turn-helix transcriptional regulator [Streptomyces broussonetiae]|uniref:DNA-binding response regulator n=1 Tax=Streptomyces broussonetiae TaxID=2686304 RepID=A0A6I6N500_9ACTN|nr:DNA-binding response regulator [Streptomyces broussonetiae]QHA06582.1 DNA-binding response regulator [Streptomyces broussonetiae]
MIVEPSALSTTGGWAGGHAAHLEQALLQARALIESTVSMHREREELPSPVARNDVAHLGDAMKQLIGRARYSVAVALTGPGEFTESALRLFADSPARATVRVLCTADAAQVYADRLRRLPETRLDARVTDSELRRVLVVDGTVALVQAPGHAAEGQFAVVHDAAAVRALELLFAGAWSASRGLADHLRLSPRLRSELVQNILERLRTGHTDEAAAREINVSLRTYRRYVAEIMRELDANSRFQAGVRAVEYGLLPA